MDQGKAADGTSTAGFIQSETFHGPKAGYYFGKGGQGVGYVNHDLHVAGLDHAGLTVVALH